MLDCDELALQTLEDELFLDDWLNKDSHRLERLLSLNRFGEVPLEGLDWVELLAAANHQITLFRLHQNGLAKAIHIVHAVLEFGQVLQAYPLIRPTVEESVALLELYELERGILYDSIEIDQRVRDWLDARQSRAEEHFQKVEACDDAAG